MSLRQISESVTAVISTYNRPNTLERAIESVLAQTLLPSELIVVDNGGHESTAQAVTKFIESAPIPIRLIRETTAGVSAARNRGILEASGPYIAFLDDDDVWAPNHLQCFTEHTSEETHFAVYAGWTSRYADPNHNPDHVAPNLLIEYKEKEGLPLLIRNKAPLIAPFYTPHMSTSVIDKKSALKIMFDEELEGREDLYFVWQLGEIGNIIIHNFSHAYLDQLEVSLFSTSRSASMQEKISMNLKKAYWGVRMLEKATTRPGKKNAKGMIQALRSAYFDYAYANQAAGNISQSLSYCLKSARLGIQVRHLKLVAKSLFKANPTTTLSN